MSNFQNLCAPQWVDFSSSPQPLSESYFDFDQHKLQNIQELSDSLESTDSSWSPDEQPNLPLDAPLAQFVPQNDKQRAIKELLNIEILNKTVTKPSPEPESSRIVKPWVVPVDELKSNKGTGSVPQRLLRSTRSIPATRLRGETVHAALPKGVNKSRGKAEIEGCLKRIENMGMSESYKAIRQRRQSNKFSTKSSPTKVLTCQYRRTSNKYRKVNKFISMAEAVSRFQNGTPDRFRTISSKDLKPGPLARVKAAPLKLTHPVSPALRCKDRTRKRVNPQEPENKQAEEEKEKLKPKPFQDILKGPIAVKKVAKKPATVVQEFRLTKPKIRGHTIGVPSNQPSCKETVERKVPLKAIPVGEPVGTKENPRPKSVACTLPPSFEARNREFLMKREEKLKNLQAEVMAKMKAEFHARPAPKVSKVANGPKEQMKRPVVPTPFSFAERDKLMAKKKEEQVKQMQDESGKVPVFHANPAPTLKPVMVRGRSRENLSARERIADKISARGLSKSCLDQENKEPNISANKTTCLDVKTEENPKNTALTLNTDKRAKERFEFNDKIRKRELEQEAKRQQEEQRRLMHEKAAMAEIRKQTEIKARPMPQYKPLVLVKSMKPPTSPRSPAWASKRKPKLVS